MVNYRGKPNAPILVLGGTPNRDERSQLKAFTGVIGSLFDDVVKEVGIPPSKVQFANAVQFHRGTEGVTFNGESIRKDARKHLLPYIEAAKPKVIVVCGNAAACALDLVPEPEKAQDAFPKKVIWSDRFNAWLVKAPDPYFLHKSPEDDFEYRAALRKAKRYALESQDEQAAVQVIDIHKPSDIDMLFDEIKIDPEIAYDYETSSNKPENLYVTTLSFSTARQNDLGEYIAYFYPQYDKLRAMYDESVMRQFREGFTEFFAGAKEYYDLIGYNSFGFDDKVTEAWLGAKFPGCTYDVMLMKWAYDTHRPHGLKETAELLLGYEDWDAKLYEVVRAIASRRSRVLTHEEDFLALKMHGYEPDVVETKRGKSYRWASKLSKDKKLAAYALADLEDVRIYNSLDSVYTKLAFNELMRRLSEDEDRAASCEFRHRIGERIMRCEQRGVWTNRELNREFSAELEKIENKTRKYLVNSVAETNPEIDEFNPNSPAQLVKVIFGEPTIVPWIDKPALYRDYARHTVDELIDRIHLEFYDDFADVKEAGEAFNFESCKDELLKYAKKVHRLKNLPVIEKKVYLDGMVRPNDERGFTKSGNPSTATFLLNEYYTLTGSEFLAMLLMYKKASKLKSVFVDGIEKMLDNEGILRGRFNLTGTRAGRLSSSNPNCQNYPKNVRGQHQPRPGYRFVEFDLSAAEVRTIAAMSGDKALLEACQAIDMHKYTASNMFHVPFDEVTDLQRQRAKAQPLDAPIATPTGWTTMGEVKVGDYVVSMDGTPTRVTGVYPQGLKKVYEVVTDDNQVIECSDEHLWLVLDRTSPKGAVRTLMTKDMIGKVNKTKGYRYAIPRTAPVQFAPANDTLPLSPYTMGVILGDGHVYGSNFSCNDPEIAERVTREAADYGWKVELQPYDRRTPQYRIKSMHTYRNSVKAVFRRIDDSIDWTSETKYIPDSYKKASVQERIALLQGLMDTDGTASTSHNYNYASVSKRLAYDVAELVRGLGGRARIGKSETRNGRVYYRVHIQTSFCPFSLQRKIDRWVPSRNAYLSIKEIRETDRVVPMQCISVDHPTHTYLTTGFVVTHNTLLFGILYGMSAFRLSYALKITVEEAESLIEDFFRTYSTLKDWIDRQPEECKQRGYHAVTLFGTKCSVKNLLADKMKEKSHAQRVCSNAPIQGTAGELTLWYICEIMDEAERRGLEVHLFNTTHDSGSFEVPIAQCEEVEQLIHEIVGATLDIEPLHLVKFKADTRISDYWSDEPNIFKAVDPKYEKEGSTVPWHLINAEEHMDKDDLEELEELEQTYEQRAS